MRRIERRLQCFLHESSMSLRLAQPLQGNALVGPGLNLCRWRIDIDPQFFQTNCQGQRFILRHAAVGAATGSVVSRDIAPFGQVLCKAIPRGIEPRPLQHR